MKKLPNVGYISSIINSEIFNIIYIYIYIYIYLELAKKCSQSIFINSRQRKYCGWVPAVV